jgi:hypothetical protein
MVERREQEDDPGFGGQLGGGLGRQVDHDAEFLQHVGGAAG